MNHEKLAEEFLRTNNYTGDERISPGEEYSFSEKLALFLSEKTGRDFWSDPSLQEDLSYLGDHFREEDITPEVIEKLRLSSMVTVRSSTLIMCAVYCGDRAAIDKYVGQIKAEIAA